VKICQVRADLRNLSLDNLSIFDDLLHMKTLVNELTSIGELVSNSEHLNLILDGLPDEYESPVSLITNRFDLLTIDEVETLLVAREVHIDCSHKRALGYINLTQSLGSMNLSQGCSSQESAIVPNFVQSVNPNSQGQVNLTTQSAFEDNSSNDYSGNHFFNGRGGWGFGRNPNHGGGGRDGDRFADVQC